ncbi:MAG: leucine-rich repeat domain-containing protein [Prevotella sp.]
MKTKLIIFLLFHVVTIWADTTLYIGRMCFRCYDADMTAEVVKNMFADPPVTAVIPATVEADGKTYTVTAIGNSAFYNNLTVSVELPPTIKSIGEYAFCKSKITEIVIPDSIQEIGDCAFKNANNLSRVVFPESVKQLTIGSMAFNNCICDEINLPEGTTVLGERAFYNCKFSTITLPSTLKVISDYCFSYCRDLENINIPEQLEYLGEYSFRHTKLESFTIPPSIKEIGPYPFYDSEISSVSIPSTLTRWPEGLLASTKIDSIEIPESVTEIGSYCFSYCPNLKSVTIPSSVNAIGTGIIWGCEALTLLSIPSSVEIMEGSPCLITTTELRVTGNDTKLRLENGMLINDRGEDGLWLVGIPWSEDDGDFSIPEGITAIGGSVFCGSYFTSFSNTENIEHIGEEAFAYADFSSIDLPKLKTLEDGAFRSSQNLESITLPEGIEEIPSYCFDYCTSLNSINIPSTVKRIGSKAFSSTALTSITLPDGLESIESFAFEFCNIDEIELPVSCRNMNFCLSKIKSIVIPEGITDIPPSTFELCSSLENVSLPSTLKSIDTAAFYGCYNMKDITLPESLTKIGNSVFSHSGITSLVIPKNVTELGSYVADKCTNLMEAEIKCDLKDIPTGLFMECSNLQKIVLPESVEKISLEAIWCCFALSDINFPATLKEIEYAGLAGINVENLKMPASLERIGEFCFGDIQSVTADLSQTKLTELPENAFNECLNLKHVLLPASLNHIIDNFYLCPEIERVECLATVPPVIEGRTFDESVLATATLVVPASALEAYRNAEVWKEFAHIDAATGITAVSADNAARTKIYGLDGVEKKEEKGLYIKGGKVYMKDVKH